MNLIRQRFRNQHLSGDRLASPEDVVRHLCCVQSQDYPGAKWSLGQRVEGGTDAIVEQAFQDGRILRTHVLRPTWHFVTPADLRWILALTGPRVHALNAGMYRKLELDPKTLVRARTIVVKALEGGRHLTRNELGGALRAGKIEAATMRLSYVMAHSELDAVICSGPVRGKAQTYALVDERVPPTAPVDREEAVAELLHRFLVGHGPATLRHFVWWCGLTVADAKRALETIKGRLGEERVIEGESWYGGMAEAPPADNAAYLIPEYDEVLTGWRDLGVGDLPLSSPTRRWRDLFLRPVLVGGKRAGTWRRTFGPKRATMKFNFFAKLTPTQEKAIQRAIERYAKYLGVPIDVI